MCSYLFNMKTNLILVRSKMWRRRSVMMIAAHFHHIILHFVPRLWPSSLFSFFFWLNEGEIYVQVCACVRVCFLLHSFRQKHLSACRSGDMISNVLPRLIFTLCVCVCSDSSFTFAFSLQLSPGMSFSHISGDLNKMLQTV